MTGHINETRVVTRADGTRVLHQRLNADVFPDVNAVMANLRVVVDHIDPPYRVLDEWVDDDGGTWRAMTFVEGTRAPGVLVSATDARAVGRAIGGFHAAVADLDPARLRLVLPRFHDPAARWRALQHEARHRDDVHDEMFRLASLAGLADVAAAWRPPAVPVRVAHHDAKADNVLLDATTGEPRAVVDLDTVMPGSWLWDVGDMVRSVAATAAEDDATPGAMAFDVTKWRAAIDGYLAVVDEQLTPAERRALPDAGPVVTWEQAVRFLADHVAGDAYYRVDRPGHNLDRARAQLQLVESMAAQRSAMMLDA